MTKQILKGFTLVMLIVAFGLGSAVAANGQTSNRLTAQVPFDFNVGNKDCRAGEYRVRPMNTAGNVVLIKSADAEAQLITLTNSTGPAKDGSVEARLVFHRYGSTYFLSQIWMAGELTGREIQKSRQERAIERELKKIASNDSRKPLYEVVEVIAMVR